MALSNPLFVDKARDAAKVYLATVTAGAPLGPVATEARRLAVAAAATVPLWDPKEASDLWRVLAQPGEEVYNLLVAMSGPATPAPAPTPPADDDYNPKTRAEARKIGLETDKLQLDLDWQRRKTTVRVVAASVIGVPALFFLSLYGVKMGPFAPSTKDVAKQRQVEQVESMYHTLAWRDLNAITTRVETTSTQYQTLHGQVKGKLSTDARLGGLLAAIEKTGSKTGEPLRFVALKKEFEGLPVVVAAGTDDGRKLVKEQIAKADAGEPLHVAPPEGLGDRLARADADSTEKLQKLEQIDAQLETLLGSLPPPPAVVPKTDISDAVKVAQKAKIAEEKAKDDAAKAAADTKLENDRKPVFEWLEKRGKGFSFLVHLPGDAKVREAMAKDPTHSEWRSAREARAGKLWSQERVTQLVRTLETQEGSLLFDAFERVSGSNPPALLKDGKVNPDWQSRFDEAKEWLPLVVKQYPGCFIAIDEWKSLRGKDQYPGSYDAKSLLELIRKSGLYSAGEIDTYLKK